MKFGIKEVAKVTFYEDDVILNDDGTVAGTVTGGQGGKGALPVAVLDSLKVSNIEMTNELAEARGGWGNAPIIAWDYGKEVNITLEDATFTDESFQIMFNPYQGEGAKVLDIRADSHPKEFAVVGESWARGEDGEDHAFKFIIPRAKVSANNTFTMEADGDPSTFTIELRALRCPVYTVEASSTKVVPGKYELIKFHKALA